MSNAPTTPAAQTISIRVTAIHPDGRTAELPITPDVATQLLRMGQESLLAGTVVGCERLSKLTLLRDHQLQHAKALQDEITALIASHDPFPAPAPSDEDHGDAQPVAA